VSARAVVKQEYQVTLRTADGKTHTWPISDCYFERKLETIGKKMLEIIRREDLTHQFSLEDEPPEIPPLLTFEVVLVNVTNMQRRSWIGTGRTRYDAVDQAFRDLTGKSQGDNLDTWKVLQAGELK
jgi:hypothetical protein